MIILPTTKTKSKILFFFIFSLCLVQLLSLIPSGVSSDIDTSTTVVESNWLYVNVGTFQDTSPHSWENDIHFASGGEDLLEFTNLGIISTSADKILYGSKAKFGFEVTGHSSVGVLDAFPDLDINAMYTQPYLYLSYVNWAGECYATYRYDAHWKYADLGNLKIHEYTGGIPITVGIKPLTVTGGNLTLNGVSFEIPEYAVNVIQTEVTNVRDDEIGIYTPEFSNVIDSQSIEVNFAITTESPTVQMVVDYLNSKNIGVDASADPQRGATMLQSEIGGDQIGVTYHNPDPVVNRYYTFKLSATIVPEIYNYIQKVEVTRVSVGVHYPLLGLPYLAITYGPLTEDYERIVGVYTQNYYIHWDFEVEVYFYATVQTNAELTQSILNDPYLKMGDWVWDTSIMGGNLDLLIETRPWWELYFGSLFNFIIIIIVLIFVFIAIYIFIRIGIPAIKSKQRKKEYKFYMESGKKK